MIGMSLSGFPGESAPVQPSLFDRIESPAKSGKQGLLDKAMYTIRTKHGAEKITFATLVKKK